MRVTQSSLTRNYLRNLNKNISNLSKSNEKLSSERSFSKVSENTADAARAFMVREQMYKNEQNIVNIRDIQGELNSAESNLMAINDILKTVNERIIQGMTDTVYIDGRKIIAEEINNLKEQTLQFANAKFASKFLFSNQNNNEEPFTFDEDGKLLFNGAEVAAITADPVTGKPVGVPENEPVYVDIGLGLSIKDGKLDKKSTVKATVSGLDMLGFGTTTVNGKDMPLNVFNLMDKIANEFDNNDISSMNDNLEQLQKQMNDLVVNITDIGNRTKFLNQNRERMETDIFNLKETQKRLEGIDIEEESIYNKTYETAWMISLQLGSKIIPPSIFDFMK